MVAGISLMFRLGPLKTWLVSASCLAGLAVAQAPALAFLDEVGSVAEEQAKEKEELKKMRSEMDQINSEIGGALNELQQVNSQFQNQANKNNNLKEVHLFARQSNWDIRKGDSISVLSYNGHLPGPVIRARQGENIRIVLHNQLKQPTSLYFHGLKVPHEVNGLPRKGSGLVPPGGTYAYQFVAGQTGTFWYHPQIVHANQRLRGLYGAIIIEPNLKSRSYDKDITLIFSKMSSRETVKSVSTGKEKTANKVKEKVAVAPTSKHDDELDVAFLINGKQAPAIPPVELRKGDRVRLRMVNASDEIIPIHLSGHRLEVMSSNGSDKLEPHVFRDSISLGPSDRVDAEFTANNPGVWSLASELFYQASASGKFPGGIACVVRYSELKARQNMDQSR